MQEVKKITEEQLKKVADQQKELQSALINIGVLDSQKHGWLHKLADLNKEIEEQKLELENQYGPININLETGEYTDIDPADKK